MTEAPTKCAFCENDAVTWHCPPPINGRAFAAVPICASAHTEKPRKRKRERRSA